MTATTYVSGATGFIAQHLVKLLLENNYKVIGSVRSREKGEHLKKLFKSGFEYEVVPDIVKKGAFDQSLVKHPEISVFFHTASPFHVGNDDIENQLLRPAVDGTINALESAKTHGKNLKKFVLTSSFAAIGFSSLFGVEPQPKRTFNEDNWTEVTWDKSLAHGVAGYIGSKALAERAAWDFVKNEKPSFSLTVVNPAYVFGPQAFDSEVKDTLNTSSEIINSFLKLKAGDELQPNSSLYYDVRDVAKVHLVAYENKAADNQRLFLTNGPFTEQNIAQIIRDNFPQLKENIAKPDIEHNDLTRASDGTPDNTRTQKILNFTPIDLETSVVDTVRQILNARK